MSVINQMLKGLEQRGVTVATEQVRPVHGGRGQPHILLMLLMLIVLLTALAVLLKPEAAVPVVVAELKPAPVIEHPEPTLPKIPDSEGMDASQEGAVAIPPRAVSAPHRVLPHSQLVVQNTPLSFIEVSGPIKHVSVAQQADGLFRKSVALMQQGRASEAMAGFEAALSLDVGLDAARQALVTMLLEGKKVSEAEQLLQDGLKNKPANSGFAMLLARLQVDHGGLDQAISTLEITLPHAAQQPDYQAFYAALLQRKSRHREAAEHYLTALKAQPNKGVWLMGYGISLQALDKSDEAKDAYQHALDSKTLSPELQAFVQQKIKAL